MEADKQNLKKTNNKKSFVLIGLLFGVVLIPMCSSESEKTIEDYKAPAFSELKTSTGKVSFTLSHKGSGSRLILTSNTNNSSNSAHKSNQIIKTEFICAPPSRVRYHDCYTKKTEKGEVNFKKDVQNKQATVWWTTIAATGDKRLYQLEVDGVKFLTYEEQSKKYNTYVQTQFNKKHQYKNEANH